MSDPCGLIRIRRSFSRENPRFRKTIQTSTNQDLHSCPAGEKALRVQKAFKASSRRCGLSQDLYSCPGDPGAFQAP